MQKRAFVAAFLGLTASFASHGQTVPGREPGNRGLSTTCQTYAVTGRDLPSLIKASIQQHAKDKVKLLHEQNLVRLENVFWVVNEKAFADCAFESHVKNFSSVQEAERWWNRIGTGSVILGPDGRFSAMYLNAEALGETIELYDRSPRAHLEIMYELSGAMEYLDAVLRTQNPSHDIGFPAQLALLKIYERRGNVPPEAVTRVQNTYLVAQLNDRLDIPAVLKKAKQ